MLQRTATALNKIYRITICGEQNGGDKANGANDGDDGDEGNTPDGELFEQEEYSFDSI